MRSIRRVVVVSAAVVAVGGVVFTSLMSGCSSGDSTANAAATAPPPPVNVIVPVEREVQDFDEFTGRVAAVESVEIRSRVSGYIQSVGFKDGDEVKKGQLLFQIDPKPFTAELDQAKAALAQAHAESDYAGRENARIAKAFQTKSA